MAYTGVRQHKRMSEINIVPYVDITLVLLVIFMITAPLFHQGVEVKLPSAPAKPLEKTVENQRPLIISVNQAGQIFINKTDSRKNPIPNDQFRNQIRKILSNGQDHPIYMRGDKDVDYGRIIEVMVMLQDAGAENIGLITNPVAEEFEN